MVDSANANGFGIRSLKRSGRIQNVFMHTSATPGTAADGTVNPNPQAGLIYLTLQDNYNTALTGGHSIVSPVTGSPVTAMTAGHAYVIVSVGSSSLTQWQAVGVPSSITPAVGVSFIATGTALAGGDHVMAVGASGIDTIEIVGDPNVMNSNGQYVLGQSKGMTIILQCLLNAALTAPADGSVISLSLWMNNSAQGV